MSRGGPALRSTEEPDGSAAPSARSPATNSAMPMTPNARSPRGGALRGLRLRKLSCRRRPALPSTRRILQRVVDELPLPLRCVGLTGCSCRVRTATSMWPSGGAARLPAPALARYTSSNWSTKTASPPRTDHDRTSAPRYLRECPSASSPSPSPNIRSRTAVAASDSGPARDRRLRPSRLLGDLGMMVGIDCDTGADA